MSTSSFDADFSSREAEGCLEASIISAYDLPYADAVPKAVTLEACGIVCSGNPVNKQQGRNTFRFESVKLVAPLRKLYPATLTVRVVYDKPAKYPHLEADLDLRTLRVDENKFLILNLRIPGSEGGAIVKKSVGGSSVADDVPPPPTIRIKLKLTGPYRPEVAALVNVARMWFGVVDKVEGAITQTSSAVGEKIPSVNPIFLLIPATPVLVVLVAAFPLVAGVAALALPFLLPVAMILTGLMAATLLGGGVVYSSTKTGRSRIRTTLGPLVESMVISKPGQALVYDTGPRPTPVSVCRLVLPGTIWSKLWISLVIDLIGSSSYLLPVAGEAFDLAWAPAQTIVIMAMYDVTSPKLKYVSFLEEILPFTDVIPSACIGWAIEFLPLVWKDHAEKNNISLDPEVTQAVTQLVTTAASVVRTGNDKKGPFVVTEQKELDRYKGTPAHYFLVVVNTEVVYHSADLEACKKYLVDNYELNSRLSVRMVVDVTDGKVHEDPHSCGGQNQGAGMGAGFNKFWYDWPDIHRMVVVAKTFMEKNKVRGSSKNDNLLQLFKSKDYKDVKIVTHEGGWISQLYLPKADDIISGSSLTVKCSSTSAVKVIYPEIWEKEVKPSESLVLKAKDGKWTA